jgi:hypothetical protein
MDIITEVEEVADNALYISESKKKFIELLQKVGYKVRWGDKAKTANFKNRMEKHYVGNKGGSQWTELHLPVSIQEIIDMGIMEESTCSIYTFMKQQTL